MSDVRGWHEKFIVKRTDGKHCKGKKHDGCRYFVIDLDHDPVANEVLLLYAMLSKKERPQLAADILRTLDLGQ